MMRGTPPKNNRHTPRKLEVKWTWGALRVKLAAGQFCRPKNQELICVSFCSVCAVAADVVYRALCVEQTSSRRITTRGRRIQQCVGFLKILALWLISPLPCCWPSNSTDAQGNKKHAIPIAPQLAADTHYVTELENCQVLLMNDARFPWLVLVPTVDNIRELYELSTTAQEQTNRAMLRAAQLLAKHTHADKMNVAALGNQCRNYTFTSSLDTQQMPHGQGLFGVLARPSPIAPLTPKPQSRNWLL